MPASVTLQLTVTTCSAWVAILEHSAMFSEASAKPVFVMMSRSVESNTLDRAGSSASVYTSRGTVAVESVLQVLLIVLSKVAISSAVVTMQAPSVAGGGEGEGVGLGVGAGGGAGVGGAGAGDGWLIGSLGEGPGAMLPPKEASHFVKSALGADPDGHATHCPV